jgi:uncharacterized protein
MTNSTADERLLNALRNPAVFDHPVRSIQVIETHISWVLLTGEYAYKIKKPVDLKFLDFSTLGKRRFFCHEELRLNRRLAPQLYLEVVAITGSPEHPRLGGKGRPIEYAVKMKQFRSDALLAQLVDQNRLMPEQIDRLAETIASFHSRIDIATADDDYGLPRKTQATVENNFRTVVSLVQELNPGRAITPVEKARHWCRSEFARCRETMQQRKIDGFIRDCHGDLHLDNIALLDGRPTPFDCIEFNEAFRWIDVISEIAFVVMDLEAKRHRSLAWRLLNRYLEITGDYAGLRLLRYYLVYRAMVRATVALIKLAQTAPPQRGDSPLSARFQEYIELAHAYTQAARFDRPLLIITHGFSGSGKSVLASRLAERLGAVRLRSDIERKRLAGYEPQARTGSRLHSGLYRREMNEITYRHLHDLAAQLLGERLPVIIDATFLKKQDRAACRQLARRHSSTFVILDVQAPAAMLRGRIVKRQQEQADPSEAGLEVLDYQIDNHDPLEESERADVISIDTERNRSIDAIVEDIEQRLHAMHENRPP